MNKKSHGLFGCFTKERHRMVKEKEETFIQEGDTMWVNNNVRIHKCKDVQLSLMEELGTLTCWRQSQSLVTPDCKHDGHQRIFDLLYQCHQTLLRVRCLIIIAQTPYPLRSRSHFTHPSWGRPFCLLMLMRLVWQPNQRNCLFCPSKKTVQQI